MTNPFTAGGEFAAPAVPDSNAAASVANAFAPSPAVQRSPMASPAQFAASAPAPQAGGQQMSPPPPATAPQQGNGSSGFAPSPMVSPNSAPAPDPVSSTPQQPPNGFAPSPYTQNTSDPEQGGDAQYAPPWHLGDPAIPRNGLSPRVGPWVAGRAPVQLLSGRRADNIPGLPMYPMPGDIREYQPERDSVGRYRLTHPETKKVSTFSRATTIAKSVRPGADEGLGDWKDRMMLFGLAQNPDLMEGLEADLIGTEDEWKLSRAARKIAEDSRIAAGSADGREFGTALHAWTEAIDHGNKTFADVPDQMRQHVASYIAALVQAQVEVIPEYVERIVYCPITDTVGTVDRIYRLPDGRLVIGDIKTSSNIDYAWAEIVAQLAQYANASHMLSTDGRTWEPMPKVDPSIGVIASIPHTPKDRGIHCDMYPVNLAKGKYLIELAMAVRAANTADERKSLPFPPIVQTYTGAEAVEMVENQSVAVATTSAVSLVDDADRAAQMSEEVAEESVPDFGPDMSDPQVAAAVEKIDAAKDVDTVVPLWEAWWPQELVTYAQDAIGRLQRKAETAAKRAATRAKNKAKKEAEEAAAATAEGAEAGT